LEIHQLAKVLGVYWREFTGNSPIGESTGGILVKVHWTFANGESPICEIPIGELPVTRACIEFFLSVQIYLGVLFSFSYIYIRDN
jgi:hypothetical protein